MADTPILGATEVYLEVLDSNNAQHIGTFVKVSSVRFNIARSPVIISIPRAGQQGSMQANNPLTQVIDMGLMQEILTLTGTCQDNEPINGVATIGLLQQIARGGWLGTTPSLGTGRGGIRVQIYMGARQTYMQSQQGNMVDYSPANQWYQGALTAFNAERQGGGTTWEWSLQMNIFNWPFTTQPMGKI